ncbi:hypothetical protein C7D74_20230, partial [Klebsiella pneumoniae]
RQRAIIYVGLDALSDAEIAAAVGNSMFADLVSAAGQEQRRRFCAGRRRRLARPTIRAACR